MFAAIIPGTAEAVTIYAVFPVENKVELQFHCEWFVKKQTKLQLIDNRDLMCISEICENHSGDIK